MIVSPSISIFLDYALKKKPKRFGIMPKQLKESSYMKDGHTAHYNKKYGIFDKHGVRVATICTKCNIEKPLTDYYPSHPFRCKQCKDGHRKTTFGRELERKELFNKGLFRCFHCKLILTLDKFSKSSKNKTGRLGHCRKCQSKYMKTWKRGNAQ